MNVLLTPELNRIVQDRIATGRYQNASEVVREGLRLLKHHERDREAAYTALKTKLERGAAQADRRELVDPGDVLRKIMGMKHRRARKA